MVKPAQPFVLFRCDATPQMGIGHAMRCLTLADSMQSLGWQVAFMTNPDAVDLVPGLKRHRQLMVPPRGKVDVAVIDHYGLDRTFETKLRSWVRRVVVIDDLADRPHDCDLLMDQTPGRMMADYAGLAPDHCRFLLGGQHALLRPGFISRKGRPRQSPPRRILVSFGGTDPLGVTEIALRAIARLGMDVEVDVVASPDQRDSLRQAMAELALTGTVHGWVDDMADLMNACDLAIGAAGTSSWERCCLGLPAVVVVVADNQVSVARALAQAGAASIASGPTVSDLTDALARAVAELPQMARAAQSICDGMGAKRVAQAISHLILPVVRPADWDDCDALLDWRNDPLTRANARNSQPVPAETHREWMGRVLADSNRLLLIGSLDGAGAGTVRFDRQQDGAWEVSITVAPAFRRLGLGPRLLRAGISYFETAREKARMTALIKSDNGPSRTLFQVNGFAQIQEADGWCIYERL